MLSRFQRRRVFLAAASLAAACLLGSWRAYAQPPRTYPVAVPHQVLAMYYGWWGNPTISGRWFHWAGVDPVHHTIMTARHYPVAGAYDSHDPAFLQAQLQQMKSAGITGLVYSFWGAGGFDDQGLPPIVRIAANLGLNVTVYIEPGPLASSPRAQTLSSEIEYVLTRYSSSPAWLRVGGRPGRVPVWGHDGLPEHSGFVGGTRSCPCELDPHASVRRRADQHPGDRAL